MATGDYSLSSSSSSGKARTCLCSPTNHPGSFRCSLHKIKPSPASRRREAAFAADAAAKASTLRAFLLQIINRSRQDHNRRRNFQPKPSRFLTMNGGGAGDGGGVVAVS